MNKLRWIVAALVGLGALSACGKREASQPAAPAAAPAATAPAPASTATASTATETAPSATGDMAAIRTAGSAKDRAYGTGNTELMSSVYEDDATLMPPTAHSARGRAAIRTFLQSQQSELTNGGYSSAIDSAVQVRVSGPLAVRTGTYATKDGSGASVDTGKFLEVWTKNGDQWRVSTEIWNSDTLPLTLGGAEDEEKENPPG